MVDFIFITDTVSFIDSRITSLLHLCELWCLTCGWEDSVLLGIWRCVNGFRGNVVITSSGIRMSISLILYALIRCAGTGFRWQYECCYWILTNWSVSLEGRSTDDVYLKLLHNELFWHAPLAALPCLYLQHNGAQLPSVVGVTNERTPRGRVLPEKLTRSHLV
jgi:hypothetical protein